MLINERLSAWSTIAAATAALISRATGGRGYGRADRFWQWADNEARRVAGALPARRLSSVR